MGWAAAVRVNSRQSVIMHFIFVIDRQLNKILVLLAARYQIDEGGSHSYKVSRILLSEKCKCDKRIIGDPIVPDYPRKGRRSLNTRNTAISPITKMLITRGKTPLTIKWLIIDPRHAPIKKKEVP